MRRDDSVSKRNFHRGGLFALFTKEHVMTPSELDDWDVDVGAWTPYRAPQR
jgi:hypothetical protein